MTKVWVIVLLIASAIAQAATTEGGSQGVTIRPAGTSAGATGELRLKELAANGANHVGLKAPDAISADKVWTLPAADGTNGQVLTTNGSGVLSFTTATGSVTDVTASSPLASSGGATPNISIGSIIGSTFGGTGNGFFKVSGPATSEKTFTFPNSNGAVLAPATIGTNAQIPISDGTSVTMRSISSDASITNAGALTIANNAITTAKITDANVTTAKIADANVTTAKIADANITYAKMASSTTMTLQRKNLLRNPDFTVWQRGTTIGITDQSYGADGWKSLMAGASAFTQNRSTDAPTGFKYSDQLSIGLGPDQKFGIYQAIEGVDVYHVRGGTVSFSVWLKVTNATNLSNIRIGVLQWTSTEDGMGADPVSAWNSENTNPTLTTWTYLNTPANLSVTTSWVQYSLTGLSVSGSATNLGVFIWNDDASSTSGSLYVAGAQLEPGSSVTPFEFTPYGSRLALCQRYCWVFTGASGANNIFGVIQILAAGSGRLMAQAPVPMRAEPTLSVVGTFQIGLAAGATNITGGLSVVANRGDTLFTRFLIAPTWASGGSGDGCAYMITDGSAGDQLIFSADL